MRGVQLSKYQGRFHSKYIPVPESGCWLWEEGKVATARTSGGYGLFYPGKEYNNGKQVAAHRYSMELHIGRRLDKQEYVLHKCDTPACVNPSHLRIGTHTDNMRDMAAKGRGNANRKLGDEELEKALHMRSNGLQVKDIALAFAISPSHMSRLLRGYRDNKPWR